MPKSLTKLTLGMAILGLVAFPAAAESFELTVAHGIPGGDVSPSLDPGLPVDVLVNGEICLLEGFVFGQFAGPIELDAGEYDIAISLANADAPCSEQPVISATVPFAEGENATVIAHLTEDGQPTASKFVNDLSAARSGRGRLIVQHTAAAPEVDIDLKRNPMDVIEVNGFANGAQAAAEVKPGNYELSIAPAGQNLIVFGPLKVRFQPFQAAEVYAVGSLANGTFTLIRNDVFTDVDFDPSDDDDDDGDDDDQARLENAVRGFFARLLLGLFR